MTPAPPAQSADPTPLVAIRDLVLEAATAQGPAHILRGVNLDIGRGRILGVVGESGSGKSALASCLIRLLPSNVTRLTGAMRFDGVDLVTLGERDMAALRGHRLAMIFQDPMTALNPLFTIGTHMTDVLTRRRRISRADARSEAEAMLRKVGIGDAALRLQAYPHQLSGGMRQRVLIAMALLAGPDLLIADEPTTALDATVEAQIVGIFAALRTEFSGSVMFISHHLGLVAQLCDDLAVMYGGTIVETGPTDAVVCAPKHPYTMALLACELDDDDDAPGKRLVSIPGAVPSPLAPMTGCIFLPRCGYALPACANGPPPLREAAPGRWIACIRDLP